MLQPSEATSYGIIAPAHNTTVVLWVPPMHPVMIDEHIVATVSRARGSDLNTETKN